MLAKQRGCSVSGGCRDGAERYVGKVDLGVRGMHAAVVRAIPTLIWSRSPFVNTRRKRGPVWLGPQLVAGISYQQWLRGRELRHGAYRGLRVGTRPDECQLPARIRHVHAFAE